ncbi:hypothetical protein [Pseudoxanthobacter sp.]|uniref:hypothetical protein n=1 Tax=Pseudoxanthobacter sp. TaxID=1925742 RepID=UPI002FE2CBF2
MSIQIKTLDFEPRRQTFGHVARRLGADKPASRYQEAVLDVQATDNFHYKPLWEPQYWVYDTRKTAVTMQDWYKPLDPRQFYYSTYNIARANMQQAVDRNFTFVEERGLIEKASSAAREAIGRALLPLRHLHWGSNMNMTEICQRGWGTAITAPCIFSSGDHLGMAQIVSRIGLVLDGQTGTSLDAAHKVWMEDAAWQGVRRLIEDSFVERDWFRLFVIQALGINAVLCPLAYRAFDAVWADAAIPVAMLTEFMTDWAAEEGRWTDAVIRVVAAENAQNKALVSGWAAEAIDRAEAAGRQLAAGCLDNDGAVAATAADAARTRARALGLAL